MEPSQGQEFDLCKNLTQNEDNDAISQFVFMSAEDQLFLREVEAFVNALKTFKASQFDIKKKNKRQVEHNINLLKIKASKIKQTIDNIVNDIETDVC